MTGTSDDFLTLDRAARFSTIPMRRREHLYTNAVLPYPGAPHILIGFPTRFLPATQQTEPTFMVSRDGQTFRRYAEAVIPHDAPDRPRRQPQQLHGLGPGAAARGTGLVGLCQGSLLHRHPAAAAAVHVSAGWTGRADRRRGRRRRRSRGPSQFAGQSSC